MIRKSFIAAAGLAALAMAPGPLAAQSPSAEPISSDAASLDGFADLFAGLFTTAPLTQQQADRLPAAEAVVATMLPQGFYAQMMGEMMDAMLAPMLGLFGGEAGANIVLAGRLAIPADDLAALPADSKIELASLLDPAFGERGQVMQAMLGDVLRDTAELIEPLFREGLGKAYATRFDEAQIADIAAFFETPTGRVFAKENIKLMADPQVMGASMQAVPAMLGQMGDITGKLESAMAALPPEKALDDLTGAERSRVAQLLGLDESDLAQAVKPPVSDDADDFDDAAA